MDKRSEHFFKIHDYLVRICKDSHLQGLKYHGGPKAECECKDSDSKRIIKVLRFVEYDGEKGTLKKEEKVKCRKCFQSFKLDEILEKQVSQLRVVE